MQRAVLLIHSYSFPYIENVARFINRALCQSFGPDTALEICEDVDAAPYGEDTIVFVIGEKLPPFRRKPGCIYVYLNFSVVTVLGDLWETGLTARRAIRNKRRMLSNRLPQIDILLDYYPPQTAVLQRQLNLPVLRFEVATASQPGFVPMQERAYDVCFVGGLNRRRSAVCDALSARGVTLSPSNNVVIEEAVAQSRICLNVHSVKCHHLETPRYVAALSAGTPIVTEPSFGAEALFSGPFIDVSHCNQIPFAVERLLTNTGLDLLGRSAQDWYTDIYLPRALAGWRETCQRVQALAQKKRAVL